jgi:two-component system, OmpR family, response regulator RegX3
VRILLVEDDKAIAEPLKRALERASYRVTWVATGTAALEADPADLILLDLGLPDMDGLDVCRELRLTCRTPIIIISARGEEIDQVLGLELGADDYLVKPFGGRELIARVRAVIRRTHEVPPDSETESSDEFDGEEVHIIGNLTINARTHRVFMSGEEIEFTPKEYDLLLFLAEDPGALRTRNDIIDIVWDRNWYGPTKTLDVHIATLRKKLGNPDWISTIRGVGFRLAPVE